MALLSNSKPISYLQLHADELLKVINDTHQPVAITENGKTMAILQDPESYENMHKAISLLKLIAQSEEDIRMGRTMSQEELDEIPAEIGKKNELFGLWSDRDDMNNVEDYLRTLRKARFF